MSQFTINDPTNEITDADGNVGIFADGDPVYTAYLAWVAADPESNVPAHTFNYPPPPAPPLTRLEFMGRFAMSELAAIYTAAKANVLVEILLDQLKMAEFVDPSDARTAEGIAMLEQAGLLDAGRADEILSGSSAPQ